MISPTTAPQYYGSTSNTSSTVAKHELDKDAFLTLLVAQLKNQDPSSPLQPHEMAAQLAQFTSVEQLTQLNASMVAQTEASHMAALVGQTSLSASLIGRQVEALGDQVMVPSTGTAQVHVDIGGAGGVATFKLLNDTGTVISTRELGRLAPGVQDLTLPSDLPPGTWHYALEVKGPAAATVAVTTYTTGEVSSVEFKNGAIVLHVGKMEISLDDLVQIKPALAGGSSSTTPGVTIGPDGTKTTDGSSGTMEGSTGGGTTGGGSTSSSSASLPGVVSSVLQRLTGISLF